MKRILEEHFPNEYNSPTVYEVPVIIDWYLEGVDEIVVKPEQMRTFLYFAYASGLASFTSDGNAYVAGMKLTKDGTPS